MAKYDCIGHIRGIGLYAAVEFVTPGTQTPDTNIALHVVDSLGEKRILISTCGPAGNILKIRPPLPFSEENCGMLSAAIDQVIDRLEPLPT